MIKYRFTVNARYYIISSLQGSNWYYVLYMKRTFKDKQISWTYSDRFKEPFSDVYDRLFNGEHFKYMVPRHSSKTHPFL